MAQHAIDLHANPSDEAIRLGPLAVRFLITRENSNGSIAAFELIVPGEQRLAAPADSHDHYEETITASRRLRLGLGWPIVVPARAQFSRNLRLKARTQIGPVKPKITGQTV